MKGLDAAIKKLARKRKRLVDGQGRIARRNARRSFLMQLAAVSAYVDDEYPTIAKPQPNAWKPKDDEPEAPKTKTRRIKV